MPFVTNNLRIILGFSFGLLVIITGAIVLNRLGEISDSSFTVFSWRIYLLFYSAVFIIYLLTIVLWSHFSTFSHQPRSIRENIIDTGLLAIGKYVPGKILGVAMRGAIQANTLIFQGKNVKISVIEQLCVLIVGVLLATSIFANQQWGGDKIFIPTVALVLCSWLAVFTLIRISQRFWYFPKSSTITAIIFSFKQSLGYLLLWVATSVPIVILLWHHYTLLPFQVVHILVAFTFAMLSGWIAFFAPGGLGVRESSFVLLAPTFMDWQDAASLIVLHRVLITVFDISYGLFVSVWIYKTVRKVAI